MAEPTKVETDQVFKALKAGKGNKVRTVYHAAQLKIANQTFRCALTAKPATQRGRVSRLAYISVSTAPACTVTWVSISHLFGMPLICFRECTFLRSSDHFAPRSTNLDSWQLAQLRTMKVGGNASATDFFTRHGSQSLLDDSDVKRKYTSRAAELYKEELARRVKEDVAQLRFVTLLPKTSFCLYS